ncbi:MAG: type II toxin-antitoxin system VapC family toxin [Candidatus Hydrogenedens sp.]|nr:type II toxin-antitoxin system VapC family toxin [Candidatus Hydrogenedentota bacterium]NLF56101.1 type II toxin-antitoxin system VapC family toxin [Candidatus Hydrogenedens sp.]
MITAVDTSVLIDVFRNDPRFGAVSAGALRRCVQEGRIVMCDVVCAELAAVFPSTKAFEEAAGLLGLDFLPMERDSAVLAGGMWRQYRRQGGDRTRVIADFLIAAHAQCQCDRLLTRDRGFCRKHFKKLRVIDPSA